VLADRSSPHTGSSGGRVRGERQGSRGGRGQKPLTSHLAQQVDIDVAHDADADRRAVMVGLHVARGVGRQQRPLARAVRLVVGLAAVRLVRAVRAVRHIEY
jgi:hypothetical protein